MRNIWHLFCGDMRRITSNVVTAIIVLGLVFIPSIFSWYNIIACWDVFDNTGNLKVAVANSDEGYESDLVPIRINIGEQVISSLRENDQMEWTFVNEGDAIDGVESGEYYAAVVIPASFSKDMMTFYSEDVEHAQIDYYTNEKKSAVAPKVTDQGADQVSYTINQVFTETLSDAALSISSALLDYAENADASGRVAVLADHVDTMSGQMSNAAGVMKTYSSILGSTQSLVSSSANLLSQAKSSIGDISSTAQQGENGVSSITEAIGSSSDALSKSLAQSSAGFSGVSDSIDAAYGATGTLSADSAATMRQQADSVDAQIVQYQTIVALLETLEGQVSDTYKPTIQALIQQMNASIQLQQNLRDAMYDAADSIEAGNADAQDKYGEVKQLASEAAQSVSGLSSGYDSEIKPSLTELANEVSAMVEPLSKSATKLDDASTSLIGASGSVSEQMGTARAKLDASARDLSATATQLSGLSQAMKQALASGNAEQLRQVIGSDPSSLATAVSAPVALDRIAVFPASNFGSQMAPLYATLGLWVGSLLLLVALKSTVSEKAQRELDHPRLHQLFLGHFGVFAVLSLAQSTCMALGNMLFLEVQVNNPFLYLVCFWTAGLVFTFFIYALVVSFANLGKAIAVFFLIIQVTSGGGSFPLPTLSSFFQAISPYLPATHVINAMRAAMMGVYQSDFWIEIGLLLLFLIPAALLGLVLRKPLIKLLDWYLEKVESSQLAA